MRPIPKKLLKDILADPYYKKCVRHKEMKCSGRITLEHALIYAGKQINEKWAILPVCEKHHAVNRFQDAGDLDKRYHEYVAVNRMTSEDEKKYPRVDWKQKRENLNKIYEGKRYPIEIQKYQQDGRPV